MRATLVLALAASAAALVPAPRPLRAPTRVSGFFDDLMDKLEGVDKEDDWKDEMFREQQAILKKRQASGGFITEEEEDEIRARRDSFSAADAELKKVQATGDLEAWKKARKEGKIKTATSGMKRDASSSRLGSAGLFAERADAKLPWMDRGFVEEKPKKAPVKTSADGIPIKDKAASPAPAAPPNPFAAFFEKKEPPAPEPEPEPEPESPLDSLMKMNPFAKKD